MKRQPPPAQAQLNLPLHEPIAAQLPDEPSRDLARVLAELLLCVAQSFDPVKEANHASRKP